MTRMACRVSRGSRADLYGDDGEREEGNPSLRNKIQQLEKTVKIFRAEMDMKMKIMEQILNNRNDQFVVYRKLLDREEAIYKTVLGHWKNTSELAAKGLFLHFSLDATDGPSEDDDVGESDKHDFDYIPTSCSKSSAAARRLRKRKLRSRLTNSFSAEYTEESIQETESQDNSLGEETNNKVMGEDFEIDSAGYLKVEDKSNVDGDVELIVEQKIRKLKHEENPAHFKFEEEIALIETVEKASYLWDSLNKEYKNHAKKEKAWRLIAKALSKSDIDTQQHWVKLRDQFTASLRKMKRGRIVHFRHSDRMQFLKAVYRPMNKSMWWTKGSDEEENSESNLDESVSLSCTI